MPLNSYFLQGSKGEQRLVQDLINEQLKIYGQDIIYLPRKLVSNDVILNEAIATEFDDSFRMEAYLANYEGFAGNGDILSKFGVQSTDQITLIISKERYEDFTSPFLDGENVIVSSRPQEGDLIYLPLDNTIFEIKYVEAKKPFYQLNKLFVYQLSCEVFDAALDELVDTGIQEVDEAVSDFIFTTKLTMVSLESKQATATVQLAKDLGGGGDFALQRIDLINDGTGYTVPPIVTFEAPLSGGITPVVVPIMTNRTGQVGQSIERFEIVNPGIGYTRPPVITIRPQNNEGSGAAATAIINEGVLGLPNIVDAGVGYGVTPTVTFSTPKHVGAAATATIASPVGFGVSVIAATISVGAPNFLFPGGTTGGVFYKPGVLPTVTFALPTGSGNVARATATMTNYNTTGGTVASIAITSEGKFYTATPGVTIDHPGFSFASATVGLAGSSIDAGSVAFTTTGRAYRTAPIVVIGTGIGTFVPTQVAVGIATIHPITGIITAVSFNPADPWAVGTGATVGAGYTVTPTIGFNGSVGALAATATANLNVTDGTIDSVTLTDPGYGYQDGTTPNVFIASPGGTDEQFRALGVPLMRYSSVKTTGTVGIGSTVITGIVTAGILLGDRVRLQYDFDDTDPQINFIPTDTFVSGIGSTSIVLNQATSGNVSVATTSFEFGIDNCGIVTGIAVTFGGGGYLTEPTVTIQNDPEVKNYVELVAGVATATGAAVLNVNDKLSSIRFTNAGAKYILTPTVTVEAPASGINTDNYKYGELVRGVSTGTTAYVHSWESDTGILQITNASSNFALGETVVGIGTSNLGSDAARRIASISDQDEFDEFADNIEIESEADAILDFTERNPFGEV